MGTWAHSPGRSGWYRPLSNPVRPRFCANRAPTPAEDHPVPPPPSEEAGRSIVIRGPGWRGLPPGSRIPGGWAFRQKMGSQKLL